MNGILENYSEDQFNSLNVLDDADRGTIAYNICCVVYSINNSLLSRPDYCDKHLTIKGYTTKSSYNNNLPCTEIKIATALKSIEAHIIIGQQSETTCIYWVSSLPYEKRKVLQYSSQFLTATASPLKAAYLNRIIITQPDNWVGVITCLRDGLRLIANDLAIIYPEE